MAQFQVAYNNRTSYYEVHSAGCKHLAMGATGNPYTAKFDYVRPPKEAESAKAFAAEFEAGNEGCLTKLGPCAKGAQ